MHEPATAGEGADCEEPGRATRERGELGTEGWRVRRPLPEAPADLAERVSRAHMGRGRTRLFSRPKAMYLSVYECLGVSGVCV